MIKTPLSTMVGGAFWTPQATILGGTSKTFDQLIKSLFANGEQGFAYDPNDLTTMFQDSAGTVPVTGAGQPVGLILDKSKGLVVSPELSIDSGFNDATKWVKDTGWSVSGGVGIATNVVAGNIFQNIQSTVGKTYLISGTVVTRSSGTVRLLADNTDIPIVTTNTPKTFSYIVRASASNIQIGFRSTDGFTGTVDNVSVKEIAGNHAYQTTSASRPILRKNATTGANYLEFDGSDDFLVTNSIDFTVTDKITIFSGFRKLSDATTGIVCESDSFYVAAPTGGGAETIGSAFKVSTFRTSIVSGMPAPISVVTTTKGNVSANISSIRINGMDAGANTGSQGVGNYLNSAMYIGRRVGIVAAFNGHIYSLIGVGRLTTDTETIALEKELAKRTGVTLSV